MKFQRSITAAVFAGILGFAGCGDDDKVSTVTGSCTSELLTGAGSTKMCTEVTADESTVKSIIASCQTTAVMEACPSANVAGACIVTDNSGSGYSSKMVLYSPTTEAEAKAFCDSVSATGTQGATVTFSKS